MNIRKAIFQLRRVRNKLSCYWNRIKFRLYGIKYGNNCIVHGHVGLKLSSNSAISIGDYFYMSSVLRAHKSIVIGNNVKFGANVTIMDSDAHSMNYLYRRNLSVDMAHKADAEVVIEDDVFIGMNTIILKGVTIGARSVIGAGSVVVKSIPSDCIAAGNPAKVIKYLNNE